ncbi:hypothetical protein CLAFUW4_09748 [Fulvia fulva]|uniref:Uncharacterized protein n=1 Tax=Passalora fulva TaxID=5499 RepID=A0A9Q8PIX2_PASFU|nr:uncharacterized protein CLAFUR5_12490 [Fulvia fulva]KAK4616302.1 hypothetical protein CLAFUR4_09753 [Fulvia fulva]KAK4617018.1 hypothetical protein CLAFUR0_09745 [Fulvia fulva]UJO23252.1 hypothetical protein CLAFUR5_12490 [Fulvia fulva]WPV19711.1 hypothetical protein CLAFUW4_09748 [Fulvia fulva]WPV34207.1 hypothetical protein CLAFUW7_09750 [Fulvia fulva]
MKFLALIALATATVALPLGDNLFADSTGGKDLPILSSFGEKKLTTKAKGPGNAKGTGNFLPGLTQLDKLSIPKRDAAALPELTVGVQGGKVVKRTAKAEAKLPLDQPLGEKGIEGTKMLGFLPKTGGILKRWFGLGGGEAEIEKRQSGQVTKQLGKGGLNSINNLKQDPNEKTLGNSKLLGLPIGILKRE